MPDGTQLAAYATADIEARFGRVAEGGQDPLDVDLYSPDTFATPSAIGDLFVQALAVNVPGGLDPALYELVWASPLTLVWLARSAGTGRMAGWYGYAAVSLVHL